MYLDQYYKKTIQVRFSPGSEFGHLQDLAISLFLISFILSIKLIVRKCSVNTWQILIHVIVFCFSCCWMSSEIKYFGTNVSNLANTTCCLSVVHIYVHTLQMLLSPVQGTHFVLLSCCMLSGNCQVGGPIFGLVDAGLAGIHYDVFSF